MEIVLFVVYLNWFEFSLNKKGIHNDIDQKGANYILRIGQRIVCEAKYIFFWGGGGYNLFI